MTATKTVRSLTRSVAALTAASRRNEWDPWDLAWPDAIAADEWCFSPELVSLHGTACWDSLDPGARQALARAEAVNFFSLNVHGERILMEGVARRLYQRHLATLAPYLHHFLEEENKHSAVFGMFCERYARGVLPDKKQTGAVWRPKEEADFLFFAQVVIFEEIVDALNVAMAADERLAPIVREINARHHADESRHLAFGRAVVADLVERSRFGTETRTSLAAELSAFLGATWREYANPAAYRDAGLDEPYAARGEAWAAVPFTQRRAQLSAEPVAFLAELGFEVVIS